MVVPAVQYNNLPCFCLSLPADWTSFFYVIDLNILCELIFWYRSDCGYLKEKKNRKKVVAVFLDGLH